MPWFAARCACRDGPVSAGHIYLGAALDASLPVRIRLVQTRRAGHRLDTCIPVLCELETGLVHTSLRDRNRRILAVLLREVRLWPLEPAIAPIYAKIYHHLRDHGRVLFRVDMLLDVLCRSLDAFLHLRPRHRCCS